MKKVTIFVLSIFLLTPSVSLANANAGKAFSGAVECTLANGSETRMPRELCKLYGGKF